MWNVGLSLLMIHYKCVWTVLHGEKIKKKLDHHLIIKAGCL